MSLFYRPEARDCRRCGRTFTAKDKHQYYCGEVCRRQGPPTITRVCQRCSKQFEIGRHYVERGQGKFCSVDCAQNRTNLNARAAETRECRYCGQTFVTKDKRQQYCGEECRRDGSPKVTRVCQACGKPFEIEHFLVKHGQGKYCSLECYRGRRGRAKRVCEVCGNTFEIPTWYAKAGWGKYCSQECQHRSHEAKRISRRCEVCGKEFSVIEAVAKKKDSGKYCSKECSDAAKRDYVTLVCEECNREFFIPSSDVNRGRGKFCCRECFDRHIYARVTLNCANCGREFETHKSQLERQGRRFCSRRCYQLYEGESSIEELIRIELEKRGEKFVQEAEIGPYNVDFLLPRRNAVIECDGSYWHGLFTSIVRDRSKNTFLTRHGYQVFRLPEGDILKSPSDCVDRVLMEV